MKKYIILFILGVACWSACKTKKGRPSGAITNVPVVADQNYSKEALEFWKVADSSSQRFTILNGRFTVNIKNADGKEQSAKGKLKAYRDSVIWASLTPFGLEVARIRADKHSFGFIDFFGKKYFQGDYSYLKEFAGYDLDFYSLQALLIGVHEFKGDRSELSPTKNEDNWLVIEKGKLSGDMRVPDRKVWFSKEYIIPYRLEYSDWKTGDKVSSYFNDFQLYGNVVFASKIGVEIKTEKKRFSAELEFKGIDFEDPETEYYFTIPEGYEQINLIKN